jgi:hypothetical protein
METSYDAKKWHHRAPPNEKPGRVAGFFKERRGLALGKRRHGLRLLFDDAAVFPDDDGQAELAMFRAKFPGRAFVGAEG